MVKMKAVDTLFISSVSSENIPPKGEFDVSAEQADRLEKDGLAKRVGGSSKEETKAEPSAPENKMEAAPANKGVISAFDHDGDGNDGGAPKGGNRKKLSRR